MAFTLKLYETTEETEIDFLGTSGDPHYELADGGFSAPSPPTKRVWGGGSVYRDGETLQASGYHNRVVTLTFAVAASTRDKVIEAWRDIERACDDIQQYAKCKAGKKWELQYQWDGASEVTYFDPLDGLAELPGDVLSVEKMYWVNKSSYYILHDCTLRLTCKPFVRGSVVEMSNLLLNPSFEFWNDGAADSPPDSWTDNENPGIVGTLNRSADYEHGKYSLQIDVTDSTGAGEYKGVYQDITTTDGFLEAGEDYTLIVYVKNPSVITNGEIQIYANGTNTGSHYALDSTAANADFTRYATKFTFHADDTTLRIQAQIYATAANCDGTIYVDKMMLVKGDFESATINPVAYMTCGIIMNHFDDGPGDVNFLDIADIPGGLPAKARVNIKTRLQTGPPLKLFRVALRRFPSIFDLDIKKSWGPDTEAHAWNGQCFKIENLSDNWEVFGSFAITENLLDNAGKFRILARVYDEASTAGTLKLRARSYIASRGINDQISYVLSLARGEQWCVADLGVANLSHQGAYRDPGAMGVLIEVKRSSGIEGARLDAVQLMPLDGGYVVARLHDAIAAGDELTLDNISDFFPATNTRTTGENRELPTPPESGIIGTEICHSFNGAVYVNANLTVYYWDGNQWNATGTVDATCQNLTCLYDFEGEMYCGTKRTAGNDGRIFVLSSGSWSESFDATPAKEIYCLQTYRDKLYAGGDDSGKIYEFDGDAWSTSYDSASATIYCMETYRGTLYAGSNNGKVYKTSDGSTWSEAWDSGDANVIKWLQRAGDYLYCGQDDTGKIYRTNTGTAWTEVADFGAGEFARGGSAMLNDNPYCVYIEGANYTVYYSKDEGVTWESADLEGLPYAMCAYGDWLYITPYILYSDIGISVGIPNIVGRPPRLAQQIDQRMYFVFDRVEDLNREDDYIYAEIHYEPQFLHVRVD